MKEGFEALGHKVTDTANRQAHGDITVVHYDNYAKDLAKGRVLWLDRNWYGLESEWVSLGWKVDNNTRRYATGGAERFASHVEQGYVTLEPMKEGRKAIVLDDYKRSLSNRNASGYRYHPSVQQSPHTLAQAMEPYSHAICGSGTCAAQAWLAGLEVECTDKHNIVHTTKRRDEWANDLAWTQFTNDELSNGYALEQLLSVELNANI